MASLESVFVIPKEWMAAVDERLDRIEHNTQKAEPVPVMGRVFSVESLADYLGFSRTKTYKLIRSGEIRSVKSGGRIVIPQAYVDAFLGGR